MFQSVWSTAPIAVSVISFLTYVVQGNELTVGTAFTAISLFSVIRYPLNVIPVSFHNPVKIHFRPDVHEIIA